ncbi:MAG TPA: YfbR-like 5'-deoxynucleotidase [Candidatus Bathyarchaeia archaeon]|nr:YfbR-like 5'-deoxynucleotidase [Candidatus Bathyarchaeia archaeon]
MRKVLTLIQVLDNLARIPRTGGILCAGISPTHTDSVADHCYKVANIALLLGKVAQKHNLEIDIGKLLEAALTGDWTDCILLDIPVRSPSYRSYFSNSDKDSENFLGLIKQGESKARQAIEDYLESEVDLDLDSQNLTEVEKKLLGVADVTALLIEILEWRYQGMKYGWFDYLWSNTIKRLRDNLNDSLDFLKPLAGELEEAYKRDTKPPNPFLTKPEFQSLKKSG